MEASMPHGVMRAHGGIMADQVNVDQVTPDQLFEQLPQYFQADKAGATNATIQWDLTGEQAGKYWLKVHDGTAETGQGEAENPNLTLTAAAPDGTNIPSGQMDPTLGLLQGNTTIRC